MIIKNNRKNKNDMKKLHWIFALLLLLAVSGACTDQIDIPDTGGDSDVPEGMVRMHITPGMLDQTVVATRAAVSPGMAEVKINNCRVLVFDRDPSTDLATTTLTQPPASATWNATVGRLDVLLFEESGVQRYICVLANLNSTNASWLDLQDAGVTYTTIQKHLVNTLPTSGTIRIEPDALPLNGWMAASVEIKKGTGSPTILNPLQTPLVTLTRGVARIDVDATATKSLGEEFKITGAGVANCPRTGTHLPDMAGKLTAWDVTSVSACNMQTQTGATLLTEKVYAYEHDGAFGSSAEHPLRIVISGIRAGTTTESFYGIDIVYAPNPAGAPDKKSMEIHRNNIYTIKLNKVRKDGYATYAEAARATSFNAVLDADITVTDPFAHDIVTNGRQYLGITNTEYVLYPFDDQKSQNLTIASFTYTSDPAWMAGQITVPPGITLPSGTQQSLAVSPYAMQRDLVVDIAPEFTVGIITLHIGNLKKEIKVRRMTPTPAGGSVYSNYYDGAPAVGSNNTAAFKEFKIGEVINFSAVTSWLQVATTDDVSGEAALSNRVVTGLGGVYVHVDNNFTYGSNTALTREASIYLAGDTQGERIRVHVQQLAADVYNNITKIEPFSYVGAFWRHNQTAERIIRMYGKQDANGNPQTAPGFWWQANVVAGQEWVVMDTNDPGTVNGEQVRRYNGGTTPNPYGIGDNANTRFGSDIEASCQVNSKLRTVSGTGNYIYFRIGLTGKLSSASATPRYGLIMISYGVNPGKIDGYHPIYIRQGEAEDYLMRPFDPITKDPNLGNNNKELPARSKSVRVSPFSLDDPNKYTRPVAQNAIDLGKNGYTFTQYPSEGGVYIQAMSTKAYLPYHTSASISGNSAPLAGAILNVETCPRGYRRISDAPVNSYDNLGELATSAIRQSIMLFPTEGGTENPNTNQNALTNQYIGYLADGYFDRQKIESSTNLAAYENMIYSCVRPAQVGEAFIGALFFNPNNYASIFIPKAGSYGTGGGSAGFTARGKLASTWTGTQYNGAQTWGLWVGDIGVAKNVTQLYSNTNYFGYPIRCVRDDRPIIETGGELPGTNTDDGSGTSIDGIDRDTDPDNNSDISARHQYTGTGTLQQQIETEYPTVAKRKQIGSIVISGDKPLTTTDYQYLNNWANDAAYTLRHITIHGNSATNFTIPAGAFTSPRWITIELRRNIRVIADGAFAATLTPGLKTLIVAYLDPVTASSGTTGAFQFASTMVNLRLNGYELEQANIPAKTWKGLTWAGIRKDN